MREGIIYTEEDWDRKGGEKMMILWKGMRRKERREEEMERERGREKG